MDPNPQNKNGNIIQPLLTPSCGHKWNPYEMATEDNGRSCNVVLLDKLSQQVETYP